MLSEEEYAPVRKKVRHHRRASNEEEGNAGTEGSRHRTNPDEKAPPGLDTDGRRRIWHKTASGEWKYHLRENLTKKPPRATLDASPTPL